MSTSAQTIAPPLAVYTDLEDTDFDAGVVLLQDAGFEVKYLDSKDPAEIIRGARGAAALLVGYAEIGAEIMAALPELRIIALMSMGFNNVDIAEARRRGIWVTNIPGAATEEVAAHAFTLAAAMARGLPFYSQAARSGQWNSRDDVQPVRLSEKRLGIVGLGRIGRRFGALARPAFAEVVGCDPLLPDTAETAAELAAAGIRRTGFDELLETSDVLSLHVPLTPQTDRLINDGTLARMPAGSYLVNVSRGALVDVPAVMRALDAGTLAGYGADVLEEEPPPVDHPLLSHPRALITPHVAYLSDRTDAEYVRQQAQNVASWYATGHPDSPLFPLEPVQA